VLNAEQELLNAQVSLISARHDVQVAYYGVLSGIGRLTARTLGLPVEYYDEERYYKEVGSRWVGDWGAGQNPSPANAANAASAFSKSAQGAPAPGAAQQATTPGTMPASGQGTNR
jgi:outer membrane protein